MYFSAHVELVETRALPFDELRVSAWDILRYRQTRPDANGGHALVLTPAKRSLPAAQLLHVRKALAFPTAW